MHTEGLNSGITDLIFQFKDRTRTTTDIENLNIVFFLEDYDLVAVDFDGDSSMVLSIYNPDSSQWRYELLPGTPARRMIQYFCEINSVKEVPNELNRTFGTLG